MSQWYHKCDIIFPENPRICPDKIEPEFRQQLLIYFPKTLSALADEAQALVRDYLEELPWQGGSLTSHMGYFAGFIRQRKPRTSCAEVAQYEGAILSAATQRNEVPSEGVSAPAVNPSLHVVPISQAADVLGRDKGLYVFVYAPKKHTVVEKRLDPYEAHLVDLLSEDRACTKSQLLELAMSYEFRPSLSRDEWQKVYDLLLASDIILE